MPLHAGVKIISNTCLKLCICGKSMPWSACAYVHADQCICYPICYHDSVVWSSCERWHTNSPRCLKQKRGSDCTPTQSDARLSPVSTQCQATIGTPVKLHLNVKQELRTYAHRRLWPYCTRNRTVDNKTSHLLCDDKWELKTRFNSKFWSNKLPLNCLIDTLHSMNEFVN